jgi:protein-disulfide isomerase
LLEGSPPGFGNATAAVTVVEFSDFQCPYCAEAARTVHKLKERYGDRVRFVFRNFPLSFHPNAHDAARAAMAAHAQGKFWVLHDRMFENQEALGPDALTEHAKAAGLDVAAYEQAFDGAARGQVDADMRLGEEVHVRGTPTLFVNRQRVENALDFDAVAEVIDAALGGATAAPAPAAP